MRVGGDGDTNSAPPAARPAPAARPRPEATDMARPGARNLYPDAHTEKLRQIMGHGKALDQVLGTLPEGESAPVKAYAQAVSRGQPLPPLDERFNALRQAIEPHALALRRLTAHDNVVSRDAVSQALGTPNSRPSGCSTPGWA